MTTNTAQRVRALRDRIRDLDPNAYSGFVVDAACRIVARERSMRSVDVVRTYRAEYPLSDAARPFPPPDALRPNREAVQAAETRGDPTP